MFIWHGIVKISLNHSLCNKDIPDYSPEMLQQFISIKTTMERTKITLSTYKVKKRKILLQIRTNMCRRCTISICNTSLILWTNKYNPTLRQWISRLFRKQLWEGHWKHDNQRISDAPWNTELTLEKKITLVSNKLSL